MEGHWLTERYKGLPRNRHADDNQNTLALNDVQRTTGHRSIWHCLIHLHVQLREELHGNKDASTKPPISNPSNAFLPILVPIFSKQTLWSCWLDVLQNTLLASMFSVPIASLVWSVLCFMIAVSACFIVLGNGWRHSKMGNLECCSRGHHSQRQP